MEAILGAISLKIIASALLVLSFLWLIIVIIKKQNEYILRALLVCLIFLLFFIYLQQQDARKLTLSDARKKIFPEKTLQYNYHIEKGLKQQESFTRYIFDDPKPKISLSMDKTGSYFHITDVKSINSILEFLNLPKVKSGVDELASITGSRSGLNRYRWDDYPPGILIIERSLGRNKATFETYHCIAYIIITKRY